MRVAVVGAGIGGLCTAIGLQRAGAEVVVLERAPELKSVGSGLSVFPNGIAALDALGLGQQFRDITAADAARLDAGQRRPDGSWLARLPHDAVSGLRVVHRAELHEMLVAGLQPATLHLGTTVSAISIDGKTVESLSANGAGTAEAFDVVVAADGINSAIRRSWPGDPGLRYSGYSSWRGVTSRPVDLLGAAGETWGRGLRFGMAPLRDGRVYWFAVATMPADEKVNDEYARVRELFGGWHAPIPALLDATDPAVVFRLPINDLANPLSTFRRGRCVLLGDAAHAMTPDLGQGANQAMEDAATLTALLQPFAAQTAPTADGVETALATYDQLRRARTQPIARRARTLGALAHVPSRTGVAFRNALMRLTPASALGKQAKAVQTWAPPSAGMNPTVTSSPR
ncbi:FAD-dependent monooxygenase [Microbacterium yannicii]|uniref:FAD-dependent monooxygenase n=1 Tax=Microbacterium yannicii TaxID=671622 RepID=UPI000686990E|nr:FAD-dependent monooxygenase [Microbacterium yannicii]